MISCASLYSSAPLRSWICPSRDLWRTLGWSSCTNHPRHLICMWLQQRTWSAEFPLCPCFWLETQPQQSLICTASTRYRFPYGLRWRSSGGRQAWQQCLWGKPVAVAIRAWQASPRWSVCWGDSSEEASCKGWTEPASSWDSSVSQGRLCMIGMKCGVGKCVNVYTSIY